MTWQSPINIPHGVIHGTADVDTNGNLFIGGEELVGRSFGAFAPATRRLVVRRQSSNRSRRSIWVAGGSAGM